MSVERQIQHVFAAAATKKMTAKEMLAALMGEDEEKKTEAMMMIAAAFPEEEPDEEKKKEAARKAAADEAEKKKEEETRKAAADEAEKKKEEDRKANEEEAKRVAANALAMATELQQVKATLAQMVNDKAAEQIATARAAIFAKRPDISDTQRAALEGLPNEQVEKVLASWPRAMAAPGSSVHALTAAGGREERVSYVPRLSESEQQIMATLDRRYASADRAQEVGSASVLSVTDPSKVSARMKQLEEEAKRLGMPSVFGNRDSFGRMA